MPQLNPDPWLLVLSSTWLTYIIILQPKISSYLPMNTPNKNHKIANMNPWTWPWT
ncbi:ATP synthase F0 subunit 8 (mitochondrion) [Chelonoidis abingdonii]|uniref:ATP synthase complex subunit 8 n=13 Tax=Chelonoidis TaxID=904181 RepID=A0A7L8DEI8_CHEAB|nr:ATP synthase F0 subunit 8 [Chelonoidis abingdonii]YP_009944900.1 ATP synthase F0 subunit 8 [Chelonoidis becki]YP_009944913.1 ATP synthase F0 subunit 8 [Chelonoidis darwini]YP_009944926.1 ATP synthase F0 subunit 8 [Chelonoidis donfaustoi]YP_009944939.1 ATP synthase F0 subunit 8 [Chelonoidis hoodensis]YP_009944952.1 ATP synthase F0 subunit 8 [Chelonoidis duncanensis]YP_009944965.1 ATP synthase F0 subunit 8 [Chelonoidis porteri]YP_009944978.1 ATP synthase F0 subunit 8 [Chelonoidis vicina]YP